MRRFTTMVPILQALLVTFLWSTSFVIIKWGLAEIHPVTYAGLRYFIAFLCFLPFVFKKKYRAEIRMLTLLQWKHLFGLGVVFYFFTQGIQFLGLYYLPAVTVSLLLNFTPLLVAMLGIKFLNEKPSVLQWSGALLFLAGAIFYFYPVSLSENQSLGLAIMVIGILANAGSSILGRNINRNRDISAVVVTFISMGVGSTLLLTLGVSLGGVPSIDITNWLMLIWLAVINTALAFTLWNHTLRKLSAMESSIINNTMLIQIAVLAWIFLDEKITTQEGIGLSIAVIGAVLVQLKKRTAKTRI